LSNSKEEPLTESVEPAEITRAQLFVYSLSASNTRTLSSSSTTLVKALSQRERNTSTSPFNVVNSELMQGLGKEAW